MITLYIFKKETGIFDRIKMGMPEQVINSLDDSQDFTLVSPPDYDIRYKWNGLEWVKAENE